MDNAVVGANKYLGSLVEYLDEGKLRPALVMREQGQRLGLLDAGGRERVISRDLVLLRHSERKVEQASLATTVAALESERARLAAELDLELLWEVVREQGRVFSAAELAELFFGQRSTVATAVVLEALLNDRLYFVRRHMEFAAQRPEQVERLRAQQEKVRLRSEAYRRSHGLIRQIIAAGSLPSADESAALIADLTRFLSNPASRSSDLTALLSQAAPELPPAETAFEILERLGAAPAAPRFAVIGGLRLEFGSEALAQAAQVGGVTRPLADDCGAVTIDDEETREVDDALSCETLPDGGARVRVYIALVADLVAKESALDREAAARSSTVYLPEATVRMLPDEVSCDRASLIAGAERAVLATDVRLNAQGELASWDIRPARIKVAARLSYGQADRLLADGQDQPALASTLRRLQAMAALLRERRRNAGAALYQRREAKVRVRGEQIEIQVIEPYSPSRLLVAEFMVLSNFVAARFAASNQIPIIYRVQPSSGGDFMMQRPRLSLYPEFHAGVGLDYYAQLSSPIRRYADLVLQRQLIGALASPGMTVYRSEELLPVLANAENADSEAKELERRAKRYWTLRYLQLHRPDGPLEAVAVREGSSAELLSYALRGTLRGAPSALGAVPILVRIGRIDPLRGLLTLDYLGSTARADARAAK